MAVGSCVMWGWGHSSEEERTKPRRADHNENEARAVEERGGSRPFSGSAENLAVAVPALASAVGFRHFGLALNFRTWVPRMTRGKQKIEAQKRAAERNEKPKGSQIDARSAGLKTVCSICKAPLANHKQLVDHFGSKHPKEEVPPAPSS